MKLKISVNTDLASRKFEVGNYKELFQLMQELEHLSWECNDFDQGVGK